MIIIPDYVPSINKRGVASVETRTKSMTRQAKYYQERNKKGLCVGCPAKVHMNYRAGRNYWRCVDCRKKQAEQWQKRDAWA